MCDLICDVTLSVFEAEIWEKLARLVKSRLKIRKKEKL